MSAEHFSDLPAAPGNPLGTAPLRRPGSIRRTSSIDMTWPHGRSGQLHLLGRARDIYTSQTGGAPRVLDEDLMRAGTTRRVIEWIEAEPSRPQLAKLVGAEAGGHLRAALDNALRAEREAGSPLYLLLDDLSGSTLIAGWAWSRWSDDWMSSPTAAAANAKIRRRMEGICIGFRPGSSALDVNGKAAAQQNATRVGSMIHPDDPLGWHAMEEHAGVSMRRARRIDVWVDDFIRIDATFQDSASAPGGERIAIHEYKLDVIADLKTRTLISVVADPRTLPYRECPGAAANVHRLVGVPLADLRSTVLAELRKTQGCTHLNDALRALADVPQLLHSAGINR